MSSPRSTYSFTRLAVAVAQLRSEGMILSSNNPPKVPSIRLTNRQKAVIGWYAAGARGVALGRRLSVTPNTANQQLKRAARKLGLASVRDIPRWAQEHISMLSPTHKASQ